jgi:hypothetical protein
MNPAQKRTGSASASSHESQDVTPPSRVAAQLDNSTLLPAPADPTTTVRRWLAPASSRPSSVGLVSSVVGSVVGRNFASANRALCGTRSVTVRCAPASPAVSIMAETEATGCRSRHPRSQGSGPGRGHDSIPGTQGQPARRQPIGWLPPRGLPGSFTPQASSSLPPGSGAALEISFSQYSPRLSKLGLLLCLAVGVERVLFARRRLADWNRAWREREPRWTRPR